MIRVVAFLLILIGLALPLTLFVLANNKLADAKAVADHASRKQQELDDEYRNRGGRPWYTQRSFAGSTVQRLNEEASRLYRWLYVSIPGGILLTALGIWLLMRVRNIRNPDFGFSTQEP